MGLNWRRFVGRYYVSNALLLCTYILIRAYFYSHDRLPYTRLRSHAELRQWERQVAGVLATALVVKCFRTPSLEGYISLLCLYGKTAMAVLTFQIDVRVFVYVVLLNLLIFMTCPQPEYRGPERIERLTPVALKKCIDESRTSGIAWLVEFYAAWSTASVHLEPVFAELSLTYGTERLKFAKVDLSRWPDVGRDYRIDVRGASRQVPTFILFEKGQERVRLPRVDATGAVARGKYRKADLLRVFDLEKRDAQGTAQPTPHTSQ